MASKIKTDIKNENQFLGKIKEQEANQGYPVI
jgi:hypothetical protein